MASVSVTSITETTVTISITGMDTGTPPEYYERWKKIQFILWDSNDNIVSGYDPYETGEIRCSDGTYDFLYERLSPGNTYHFRVIVDRLIDGIDEEWSNEFWYDDYFDTTNSGGGGDNPPSPSSDPYFEASAANGGRDIYVSVGRLSGVSYSSFKYSIVSSGYTLDSPTVSTTYYTFENVPDGTYNVMAWYMYNNIPRTIYTYDGLSDTVTITINNGGGGGSDAWELVPALGTLNIGTSTASLPSTTYRPYKTFHYEVVFSTSGTPRIYSVGNVDITAFFSDTYYNIDPSDGIPIYTEGVLVWEDSASGLNFDTGGEQDENKPNVTAGVTYHLWVKIYSADSAQGNAIIYFEPPAAPQTGGYVWIYTSSEWVRAKPYIYIKDSNNVEKWVPATPYIYTDNGWVQTT